jgi:hypothetical protein
MDGISSMHGDEKFIKNYSEVLKENVPLGRLRHR